MQRLQNANFDEDEFVSRILKSIEYREAYKTLLQQEGIVLENKAIYELELTTKGRNDSKSIKSLRFIKPKMRIFVQFVN